MAADTPGFDDMYDIVTLDPVPWWPLAPGWVVVLLVLAILLFWFLARALKQWQHNAYRREAIRRLQTISPEELPSLVKRVCVTAWPREQVAALSGDAWLQFLDRSGGTTDFTQGAGPLLLELSYNPSFKIQKEDAEYQQLINSVRRWINQSRTG